ncbi:MAG: ligand-binding protein SH3 [Actinomycetota bacterium]
MLITGMPADGIVTVNRVILKQGFDVDDLQERVALLCENVKTYHSDTGFVGGFVCLNSGQISNEGSTCGQTVASPLKDREALIVTFWRSFEEHEQSHRSPTFQPLFRQVLDLCENGNEEIGYSLLWQGAAYTPDQAEAAKRAKQIHAA